MPALLDAAVGEAAAGGEMGAIDHGPTGPAPTATASFALADGGEGRAHAEVHGARLYQVVAVGPPGTVLDAFARMVRDFVAA